MNIEISKKTLLLCNIFFKNRDIGKNKTKNSQLASSPQSLTGEAAKDVIRFCYGEKYWRIVFASR